jgi:hypothetical protein
MRLRVACEREEVGLRGATSSTGFPRVGTRPIDRRVEVDMALDASNALELSSCSALHSGASWMLLSGLLAHPEDWN